MELDFTSPAFWLAVGQIVLIDILLGGDNAVVIALAVRKLDPSKRRQGIVWGTIGAIALRILLIVFALSLLSVPYLKVVGALLLLWIGVKLLLPEEEDAHGNIASSDKLWVAVRTVIVADLVMSIDNVIAIAGAAQSVGGHHEIPLVLFGLLASVPRPGGGTGRAPSCGNTNDGATSRGRCAWPASTSRTPARCLRKRPSATSTWCSPKPRPSSTTSSGSSWPWSHGS